MKKLKQYLEETRQQQLMKQKIAKDYGVYEQSKRSGTKGEVCGKKLMRNLKEKGLSEDKLKEIKSKIY